MKEKVDLITRELEARNQKLQDTLLQVRQELRQRDIELAKREDEFQRVLFDYQDKVVNCYIKSTYKERSTH